MYITFFNQGDHLTTVFEPRPDRGPNFYWFHNSFFSHVSIQKQDRYLHLFVKDMMEVSFTFMQYHHNIQDAFNHQIGIKIVLDELYRRGQLNPIQANPPILRSDDVLVPDLIFDFEKEGNNTAIIIYPEEDAGTKCQLFTDKHVPIPFNEVPEILKILPHIKESIPFLLPEHQVF